MLRRARRPGNPARLFRCLGRRHGFSLLTFAIAAACDQAAVSTAPPSPSTPLPLHELRLEGLVEGVGVGELLAIDVFGYTRTGSRVSANAAVATLSDPGSGFIATVEDRPATGAGVPPGITYRRISIQFTRSGLVTLRVTVEGISVAHTFNVRQTTAPAVVVDSFTVVESRVTCNASCPYLAYWPVLKLRATSELLRVTVTNVEVALPGHSTGQCAGHLPLERGASTHLIAFDDYLWENEMIFVSLRGIPLPGPAVARVSYADERGRQFVVEAVADIQRLVTNPGLPRRMDYPDAQWFCPGAVTGEGSR